MVTLTWMSINCAFCFLTCIVERRCSNCSWLLFVVTSRNSTNFTSLQHQFIASVIDWNLGSFYYYCWCYYFSHWTFWILRCQTRITYMPHTCMNLSCRPFIDQTWWISFLFAVYCSRHYSSIGWISSVCHHRPTLRTMASSYQAASCITNEKI